MEEGQAIAILAVDDEPGVLALVRRCLDDARVTLTEASSGKDALEQIAEGFGPQPVDHRPADAGNGRRRARSTRREASSPT